MLVKTYPHYNTQEYVWEEIMSVFEKNFFYKKGSMCHLYYDYKMVLQVYI